MQHKRPQELSSKLLRHFRFWTQNLGPEQLPQVLNPGGFTPAQEAKGATARTGSGVCNNA